MKGGETARRTKNAGQENARIKHRMYGKCRRAFAVSAILISKPFSSVD